MKALLLMTDGVADDYFPNDPHILKLYGDLVLNGAVLPTQSQGSSDTLNFEPARLPELAKTFEVARAEGLAQVPLWSLTTLAVHLGCQAEDIATSPALAKLWADFQSGSGRTLPDYLALLLWIDSYQVKGSFDDRTLVVLHR